MAPETAHALSDEQLALFSEFLSAQLGLFFPKERWRDLERGIKAAARAFHHQDPAACLQWLMSAPLRRDQIEILASHLTVGETYFWREKSSFEILETYVLPELINRRRAMNCRQLRIWSAGCASGEEPYSIAMQVSRLIPDLKDWRVTILGTDINPRLLKKAEKGLYKEWSFRDAPRWLKANYFRKDLAGHFELLPRIKEMVTFASLNLAADAYPSLFNNTQAMDIIFCRNVLMYFKPEQAKRVIRNLYRCLVEGGWLFLSPIEASMALLAPFQTVNFPRAVLYRKLKEEERPAGIERMPAMETVESNPSSPPPPAPPRLPATDIHAKARALYERGSYQEAAELLTQLLAADGDDAKAMALLARVRANQGKLKEALDWCGKAIERDKFKPAHYYLKATILEEQGNLDEAVLGLKQALYLDADFALAHLALGNLLKRQGKPEAARRYFANALSLLKACDRQAVLPESAGMTAGRLMEMIRAEASRSDLR